MAGKEVYFQPLHGVQEMPVQGALDKLHKNKSLSHLNFCSIKIVVFS